MRLYLPFFFTALVLGQSAADSRNTRISHTDTHFSINEYKRLQSWEKHRTTLRAQVLVAAGLDPLPERCPLKPSASGLKTEDGFTVEKVLIQTLPGYFLGGNLYRPAGSKGRHPAVLSPHGHWKNGRREQSDVCSTPALGASLARQGYVVFAYDMVGYNDTRQTPHDFGGPAEQLWSFGPLGLQLWNSIRATDFLASLPDVDPSRLAATGASGGGTQTFLLTAVDSRIRYSAPVNMVSAIMQGGCVCENAPGLRAGTFNVEIASMMAPRPMLVVSATGDWTRNVPKEEFPAIQRIYGLYGKSGDTEVVQIDAPHNYNLQSREAVYSFFARQIPGKRGAVKEQPVRNLTDDELLAGTLPEGALTYDQLFENWKKMAREQNARIRNPAEKRRRLTAVLGAEWPAKVESVAEGGRLYLTRPGRGDRIPAILVEGRGDPVLVVHPDGAVAGRALVPEGRAALCIDAFQTGAAVAERKIDYKHYLTFQHSDDAYRVQDVLTALAFLNQRKPGRLELIGQGKAGVWALYAAAVAPIRVKLSASHDQYGDFFVPGIERAGGLEFALSLVR